MAMRYYAPFPAGAGEPPQPRAPHAMRIGDAERDAAAADLGEHYAAGRLTLDELNERLEAVFSAKTFGQLAKIMTDLPGRTRTGSPGALSSPGPRSVWQAPNASMGGFQSGQLEEPPTSSDRAGRFAALSLLLLAMLIWLFTALLFVKHGGYQGPYGGGYIPSAPFGHFAHTLQFDTPIQAPAPPVAP